MKKMGLCVPLAQRTAKKISSKICIIQKLVCTFVHAKYVPMLCKDLSLYNMYILDYKCKT